MKRYHLSVYSAILLLILSFFFSCDNNSGLGEQVDLDAPTLKITSMTSDGSESITSFAGGVYCHKDVTFAGTATDNNRVARVYTQLKWASDSSDFTDFKTASISGDNWNLSFAFEKEGVALLKFIATDPAGNVASKSSKTLILFVDETPPVGNAWYIDRKINGIQYKLHELDYLKSLDLNKSSNIDAAQNVFFSISGAFTDEMGISEDNPPTITLYGEDGTEILKVQKEDDSSVYQPEFKITHDALVAADSSLATGLHYIQARYSASDVVKVPSSNAANNEEFDGGWFIYWPESDVPRYELSEEITESGEEKSITVYVNSSFSITVFDDDSLESVASEFSYKDEEENKQTEKDEPKVNDGEREKTLTVHLPSTPQTATLKLTAKGKKGDTDGGKTLEETITVNVIDATAPMLLITSPKNNSVPEVSVADDNSTAKVTISGTSLDVAGGKYLEFVWVPDSIAGTTAEKSTIAKNFLSSLKTDTQHDSYAPSGDTAKKTEISDVGILWSVPLKNKTTTGGFVSHEFSFDIDLFNDFDSASSAFTSESKTASDKFFVARLTRSGETGTNSEYKLAGDISNPTIVPKTPTGDMAIVSGEEELVLEFYGKKDSGMKMDTGAYEIRRTDEKANDGLFGTYSDKGYATVTGYYDEDSETYKSKTPIPAGEGNALYQWKKDGTRPKFQFVAKDLLGNEGKDQFTIVISTLPLLKSVTSPSSTLLKKGDELLINAVFDNTVSVSDTSGMYVKLEGFSDNKIHEASYKSGSGSTTLVFSYTVQDGDESNQVQVKNDSGSPIEGLSDKTATLVNTDGTSVVSSKNLLQAKKTIAVDGKPPVATVSSITSDIASSKSDYTKGSITYLKEGRTFSVTVTASEAILISGSPVFTFNNISLPFTGSTSNSITFSKKIEKDDTNGALTYIPASCISDPATITDSAGNPITLPAGTSATASAFAIDTNAPKTPTLAVKTTNYAETINSVKYYKNAAIFTATAESSDSSVKSVEYSTDGGSTWKEATSGAEVTLSASEYSSVQLVCRATDYAGNVSALSAQENLQINSTFPAFTVECTNADGHYKAGSKLIFKVSFDEKVKYSTSALYTNAQALKAGNGAYIQLSALNSDEKCGGGANGGRAYLSDKSGNAITSVSSETDSVYFTYEAQDPDEFTLKVASDAVHLTGFTDLYGIAQGSNNLSGDYSRKSVVCDGVAPKVVRMTPGGTAKTASDGKNVYPYTEANKITLVFSEPIQKAGGNIYLRQVDGWAIPPVLSANDFNTILANLTESSDKETLAKGASTGTYAEDVRDLNLGENYANDLYYGRGDFVGPYKKSMQGVTDSLTPDISTKFVLDFDIGIYETTAAHPSGTTYDSTKTAPVQAYARTDQVSVVTPTSTTTADKIRATLEKAGYHRRTFDATAVTIKNGEKESTVTFTFAAGICGDAALELGRKWELVIEKGAFMDMTGNEFGAEANGDIINSNAVQIGGTQYTVPSSESSEYDEYTGSWARKDTAEKLVLIANGSNEYFWSSGVATPVVRVDRYSYGLGIIQPNTDLSSYYTGTTITTDSIAPTAKVRVRIDCETPGASIKYAAPKNESTMTTNTQTANYYVDDSYTDSNRYAYSYISVTDSPSSSVTPNEVYNGVFTGGTGDYTKSCKQIIVAQATYNGDTSETGKEGIFQTVVHFVAPTRAGANGYIANQTTTVGNAQVNDFSIRGQTGFGGEPYISPFPLRGSRVGSPYLRKTYRTGVDYYWVSYEILVQSGISAHGFRTRNTQYCWAWNGGNMLPGEVSRVDDIELWN